MSGINIKEQILFKMSNYPPVKLRTRWSVDDEEELEMYIGQKKELEFIAEKLQRTVPAIQTRIRQIAVKYVIDGHMQIEEASKFTGLAENIIKRDVTKYLNRFTILDERQTLNEPQT